MSWKDTALNKWQTIQQTAVNLIAQAQSRAAGGPPGKLHFTPKGLLIAGKVLTVVLCAYFLADVTALIAEKFIAPPPPVLSMGHYGSGTAMKPTIESYEVILRRNLFNHEGLIGGETPGQTDYDPNSAPVKTSLPLNLIGTVIFENPNRSLATIEDRGVSMVYPVRIEDEIPDKIRVKQIEPRKVSFVNLTNHRMEYVDLPEDATALAPIVTTSAPTTAAKGVERVSSTHFNVNRGEIDAAMANFGQVLTQARAIPNFENGVQQGYRITQIVPGSIYQKIGIAEGDVILGMNGEDVNDPAKAFGLLNELKTANHLELKVKRNNGKETVMVYDIGK